jgi:hydroxymethylglutaryl-CoA reductase
MKMHLNNIINQFNATTEERVLIKKYFKDNTVAHSTVVDFIQNLRK